MTVVRTLAQTTFQVGVRPPLTHPNPLPANASSFLFRYQPDNSTGLWLLNLEVVATLDFMYAADGIGFVKLNTKPLVDEECIAYGDIPAGEGRWSIDIPDVGLQTRKVQVNSEFFRRVRFGGTLEVF